MTGQTKDGRERFIKTKCDCGNECTKEEMKYWGECPQCRHKLPIESYYMPWFEFATEAVEQAADTSRG